jgi:H+/gluconate symporter-like permease
MIKEFLIELLGNNLAIIAIFLSSFISGLAVSLISAWILRKIIK